MSHHVLNFLLGSFGIVAALLLIGGSVLLRAQQNRYRFELAKKSIETGVPLPPPEPLWKGLHRQAQSILAVGLGLMIVGAVAWGSGVNVQRPSEEVMRFPIHPPTPPAYRDNHDGPPMPPPRPNVEVELWQRAQTRIVIGQTALGCGVILTLLGLSRRGSAKTERASQSPPSTPLV